MFIVPFDFWLLFVACVSLRQETKQTETKRTEPKQTIQRATRGAHGVYAISELPPLCCRFCCSCQLLLSVRLFMIMCLFLAIVACATWLNGGSGRCFRLVMDIA